MTLRRWIERSSFAQKPWSSIARMARLRRRLRPLTYGPRTSCGPRRRWDPGWPFAEGQARSDTKSGNSRHTLERSDSSCARTEPPRPRLIVDDRHPGPPLRDPLLSQRLLKKLARDLGASTPRIRWSLESSGCPDDVRLFVVCPNEKRTHRTHEGVHLVRAQHVERR